MRTCVISLLTMTHGVGVTVSKIFKFLHDEEFFFFSSLVSLSTTSCLLREVPATYFYFPVALLLWVPSPTFLLLADSCSLFWAQLGHLPSRGGFF